MEKHEYNYFSRNGLLKTYVVPPYQESSEQIEKEEGISIGHDINEFTIKVIGDKNRPLKLKIF